MVEPDLELSDCIVDYDPHTLERRRVRWQPVLEYYQKRGNRLAQRVVRSLPKQGAYFDELAVDQVLVMSHMELQRVEEEFLHGHRVLDLLRAVVDALLKSDLPRPIRVVDVGCGLGYVVRWLTSFGGLGPDVELVGVDYNRSFIRVAQQLAAAEGLRCSFSVANAFELSKPGNIFLSSGVLHHFRGAELTAFLEQQCRPPGLAFIHTDILPSPLSPLAAWVYHQARMRQPLARHDGPLSARRAHPAAELERAAQVCSPRFAVHLYDRGTLPFLNVFQSLIGVVAGFEGAFLRAAAERGLGLGA